jgi:hypothetical protein
MKARYLAKGGFAILEAPEDELRLGSRLCSHVGQREPATEPIGSASSEPINALDHISAFHLPSKSSQESQSGLLIGN